MDSNQFKQAWGAGDKGAFSKQWNLLRRKVLRVAFLAAAIAIATIVILSSYFTVEPDEVGVVTRFGRYSRIANPGLHFKFPWGIEQVERVRIQRVHKEEFGFRTEQPGVRTRYRSEDFSSESLMLTGDLNIADVEWIVQYRIADPYKYLYSMRSPERALRDASESVMREVVGDRSVTEVLTAGRAEINSTVSERLQEVLDLYECGLRVVTVKLQDVNPPDAVKASFNEVNEAKQEKEKTINQAYEAYNKVVPLAKGKAEQIIAEAEGFAIDRANRAEGDASRFLAILEEYKKAPDVTRQRLYLETLRRVLPRVERKIITDADDGAGVLPLLHLSGEDLTPAGGTQ